MNRRNFLLVLSSIMISAGQLSAFAAELLWLKPGGPYLYKEKGSAAERKCSKCVYFVDDSKTPVGGLCNYKGISRGKHIYVKKDGICSMFKRKTT